MKQNLEFLKGDPTPVAATQESGAAQTLPDSVVTRLMTIEGVEGVWIREPAIGPRAVIVAISRESARQKVPSVIQSLPVEFQFTGPITALPVK